MLRSHTDEGFVDDTMAVLVFTEVVHVEADQCAMLICDDNQRIAASSVESPPPCVEVPTCTKVSVQPSKRIHVTRLHATKRDFVLALRRDSTDSPCGPHIPDEEQEALQLVVNPGSPRRHYFELSKSMAK